MYLYALSQISVSYTHLVQQEVTAINPTEKTVTVHALDSGKVYTETYDKLLLAPGAKPTVPDVYKRQE